MSLLTGFKAQLLMNNVNQRLIRIRDVVIGFLKNLLVRSVLQ